MPALHDLASAALTGPPQLVLLVDPYDDERRIYKQYLAPRRYIVEEAADGREALAKAFIDPPDIVVTETRLEGMDGYGLCEMLRRDRETCKIPIVVVTGDDRPDSHDRARQAGADIVLVKPCPPPTLIAQMRRLQDRSAELRERARAIRATAEDRLVKSAVVLARAEHVRKTLSKKIARYETTTPPTASPELMCPACQLQVLRYERSFIGGVNEYFAEQWDELTCPSGCGTFQYRHRTRKLARIRD